MSRFVEEEILNRVINALRASGNPVIAVYDTEDETPAHTNEEIAELVFDLDEAYLITQSGAWVFMVNGNEWDTISDYNVSLEEALKPVNDWIEANW